MQIDVNYAATLEPLVLKIYANYYETGGICDAARFVTVTLNRHFVILNVPLVILNLIQDPGYVFIVLMSNNTYSVYILASQRNGTLYIGVTNNLKRRLIEHKERLITGFTDKYKVHLLVHYEHTESIEGAIAREKQLKNWRRRWKTDLIEKSNPTWRDLSLEV